MALLGGLAMMLVGLVYFIAQLVAARDGIAHFWGSGWAIGIIFLCMVFRFTLPITVGAFLGAWLVWQWHWALAGLFAAPGLALALPSMLAGLIGLTVSFFRRRT